MSAGSIAMQATPLESWIAAKIGVSPSALTREAMEQYQLNALRETVAWARQRSSFYARRLDGFQQDLPQSLDDFRKLPLTSQNDLAGHAAEFLCVPQDEISRIVTFDSSGTGGTPKRVFFTAEDQELALDFFAHGVATMAAPGDRMLIALPGEREGSVGYQLAKGISRAGIVPVPHGLSTDCAETLAHMERERATCIIGLPVQMLALARNNSALANQVFRRLRSIVLCSDHVPDAIVHALRRRFDGEVFEHYGSTEMGLGGGVDCAAHMGYHLREADLYYEVVSPVNGRPVPDGELGEVVFTTLGRRGMPLIRYSTGDFSRILPGRCECGSIVKRLERVRSRVDGHASLGNSGSICMAALDEALFAIPDILDFSATLIHGSPNHLEIAVCAPEAGATGFETKLNAALSALSAIRKGVEDGQLSLSVRRCIGSMAVTGAKRKIEVRPS